MKLFLASEAKNPITLKNLDQYCGGLKNKRIVYIPTAANGEEDFGAWKNGTTWNEFSASGAHLTIVQLEDYKNGGVHKELQNKDIIFFAGGMPGYLMYWVRRTELDKSIRDLLANGALYVGSSAGSMITAPTLKSMECYIGESEHGAEVIPGLGLVDFGFYPHYIDEYHDETKKRYTGNKIYLVKNEEAIIVEDGKVTVLGEKRVI